MQLNITNRLPVLPLGSFVCDMKRALPQLIQLLTSRELRADPFWGTRFPFDVEVFGDGTSVGHCVRPDIIIDENGQPFITELDFVPSGRGFTFAALPEEVQRRAFLDSFANWYTGMGVDRAVYGTTIEDPCRAEVELFARAMAAYGFEMESKCVDRDPLNGVLIDRLFYWAEVAERDTVRGRNIITAEPWLDTKMAFALIHDPDSESLVRRFIDDESLEFLRRVMPHSMLVELLRSDVDATRLRFEGDGTRESKSVAKAAREAAVIKNTDIEASDSWGCRGTMLGRRYSATKFMAAILDGVEPTGKGLGQHPIVQAFHQSADFALMWDAVVDGRIHKADPKSLDRPLAEIVFQPARKHVFARVGVYFLVNNHAKSVAHAPYGVLTLRQDALAHGSSDAIITAFEVA